jgi:hypothetical protein
MPTTSRAQQRLMYAVARGAKPKGGHGPSRKVAQEFVAADHQRGSTKLPERVGHAIVANKAAKDI